MKAARTLPAAKPAGSRTNASHGLIRYGFIADNADGVLVQSIAESVLRGMAPTKPMNATESRNSP